MKILFTAFEGMHNTSFQLADQTGADYVLLTNSFPGRKRDISSVSCEYDSVYMFGVDKRLTDRIRIEMCAVNHDETVRTQADISCLEEKLKAREISYVVSDQPADYLCNASYYHMLSKNPKAVFIHIPSLSGMTAEMMKKPVAVFKDIYFV